MAGAGRSTDRQTSFLVEAVLTEPDTAGVDQLAPLATRMRPRTLEEYVGQEHLIGPGRALRRAVEADRVSSMILWGPPGSGKTTLAEVISRRTRALMIAVSGVSAGIAELRRAAEEARRRRAQGQRTILFIDEIHRFNRTQQDAVLPHVESGLLTLIGATTENPSFEVNGALLSRSRVYRLEPLGDAEVDALLDRALADAERGLGKFHVKLDADARAHLLALADGDARIALNALEVATLAVLPDATGARHLTLTALEDAIQRRAPRYDRAGDQHYDLISAFIKSVRGSDPDAAIYWLARMLEAGEDLLFIARRLVILASEDVGLADPMALPVAMAAQQAAHLIGLPEAFYPLGEATLYLACAPKSNSTGSAYGAARAAIQRTGDLPVPRHLRNAATALMRGMGYGQGYRYAHDYEGHVVAQPHLPDLLAAERFFIPSDQGYEVAIRDRLARLRARPADDTPEEPPAS